MTYIYNIGRTNRKTFAFREAILDYLEINIDEEFTIRNKNVTSRSYNMLSPHLYKINYNHKVLRRTHFSSDWEESMILDIEDFLEHEIIKIDFDILNDWKDK